MRGALCCGLLMLTLLLGGCAQSQLSPYGQGLPERVELSDVPFFALSDSQGGPSALAAVLNQLGVISSPGLLDQLISASGRNIGEPSGLIYAAQHHELLVYPLPANLDALLQQVAAGQSVLLAYKPLLGMGAAQFAVLVGFDRRESSLILRSGNNRRSLIGMGRFDRAWASAGHWAVVITPTHRLPAHAEPLRWQQGVRGLGEQGLQQAAEHAERTGRRQWSGQ
jgi:hypothetical protein